MVTVPAFVWRGGSFRRGATVGVGAGVFFGALAWLDSAMVIALPIVFVLLGIGYGVWMARRMAKGWPGARALTGAQRVAAVGAARRGERIGDDALAPAVIDYSQALHAAAEGRRPLRWVIVIVLIIAAAVAVWDAVYGSVGNAVASFIYLVLIAFELFWWPKWRARLLADVDRASALASQIATSD